MRLSSKRQEVRPRPVGRRVGINKVCALTGFCSQICQLVVRLGNLQDGLLATGSFRLLLINEQELQGLIQMKQQWARIKNILPLSKRQSVNLRPLRLTPHRQLSDARFVRERNAQDTVMVSLHLHACQITSDCVFRYFGLSVETQHHAKGATGS
jgi:hypothetical protein